MSVQLQASNDNSVRCSRLESYTKLKRLTYSLSISTGVCFTNAIGVGDQTIISDNQITATSYLGDIFLPAYGRLYDNRGDGWCAFLPSASNDWLQVDLGKTFLVCGVATQGDAEYDLVISWVTAFKLSYSSAGNTWTTYKDENGIEVVRFVIFY